MTPSLTVVAIAAPAVTLGGPVCVGLLGMMRNRGVSPTTENSRWDWRLAASSSLWYAFAFSLILFIQELFLVVPKALTPGLRPTLFHNNHDWVGTNPLANLFQGTGALAVFVTALIFAWWLTRHPSRSTTMRLFVILPQVMSE